MTLDEEWEEMMNSIKGSLGKKPADLNAILYLIGVQELGQGVRHFSKEEKQDLMHIATCKLMSLNGYYTLRGLDEEGWPIWAKTTDIPALKIEEQETLLKINAIEYLKEYFNENN